MFDAAMSSPPPLRAAADAQPDDAMPATIRRFAARMMFAALYSIPRFSPPDDIAVIDDAYYLPPADASSLFSRRLLLSICEFYAYA